MGDCMTLSKNLRRLLEEHQLSVAQLSQRSGVPAKTLYHWLSGQQPQKIEHLFKISDAFTVSIEELYGREKRAGVLTEDKVLGIYEVILRPVRSEK